MNTLKKLGLAAAVALVFTAAPAKADLYNLSTSTPTSTGVILTTGAGLLNDIEISTGAAGSWCIAIDSAATISIGAEGSATAKRLGAVSVVAANTTTSLPSKIARPFRNGVAIVCNAALNVIVNITQ